MKKNIIYFGLLMFLLFSCTRDGASWKKSYNTFFIEPSSGTTLSDIDQTIFVRQIPPTLNVYRYRFTAYEITTTSLPVQIGQVETTTNNFSMLDFGLSNLKLAAQYKISIEIKKTSTSAFSPAPTRNNEVFYIVTPALPERSKVIEPQSGSVVNSLWTSVFAKQTLGAEKYRFVVVDGTQTRVIEGTASSFQLADLPGGPAANTQYFVRVDIQYQGVWYSGTDLCSITTSPTASLRQTAASSQMNKSK
jgi:hypothetical protein